MSDDLDILLPGPPAAVDSWRWGTVTATGPLRVRLDGDGAALSVTPDALGPVRVGGRVWCQIVGRRVVVWPASTVTPGPVAMAAGAILVPAQTISESGYSSPVSVTYPAGRFAAVPVVTATLASAGGGTAFLVARTTDGSTAGTTVYATNTGPSAATFGADLVVHWVAVQMTPASGPG